MKRFLFLVALVIIALTGTGCRVNLGGQLFDCEYPVTCTGDGLCIPSPIPYCTRLN